MGLGALLARLTAILIVLAILAGCAGYLLPRERTIESKAVILAPPERVFDFVTDVKGYSNWRDDVANVVIDDGSNPPSWSEKASGWQLTFREVKRERPKRYEVEFESPSGFLGRRTYVFEPTETGDRTKLTRTDVIEISNPLKRVYSYLAINLESLINAQSDDLGREFLSDPLEDEPNDSPTESPPAAPVPSASTPAGSAPTSGGLPSPSPMAATPTATRPAGTPAATTPAGSAASSTSSGPAAPAASGTLPKATPTGSPSPTPARI